MEPCRIPFRFTFDSYALPNLLNLVLVHQLITNARMSTGAFYITTFPSGKDVLCQSWQSESKREITRWRMHWSPLDDIWEGKKRRNRFYNKFSYQQCIAYRKSKTTVTFARNCTTRWKCAELHFAWYICSMN